MKFFADRMLGKLAKKLRLLGFDTLYFNNIEEKNILELLHEEERILLTRDRSLHSRALKAGIDSYLLKSNHWNSQLRSVIQRFRLTEDNFHLFYRCSECNAELEEADAASVSGLVPDFVLYTNDKFMRCPGCGRIYWKGTHLEKIIKSLQSVINLTRKD
ncbi:MULTISPECIES: Mut7-C RNAse domain-containing protein [unclassified Kosmotoga]|uniref:Mut7-C RNAse domain-containing protein n=1 Tax=unclassified Kosmotoga TaxID=2631489 RepID=UPI0007C5C782|nr:MULTISPECIES: Mut7-C RNAse domain-containing protein [unclassified Kosmotoga]MDI3524147.1 uncharacterized protein [Kosmotoga sp.]MDK2952661.1 uncharacterized protein [Kosmotoga sp.]OAA25532.1 hypothetical protein DU53_00055 [Kosmotoga sp. DU53]